MARPNPGLKIQDPQAIKDYKIDWSDWLADAPTPGDTISASSWTVHTDLTATTEGFDDDSATIWLAGGTVGETYEIINHITTAAGREDDCTFKLRIENE